jgi:predicted transcriptional regulator
MLLAVLVSAVVASVTAAPEETPPRITVNIDSGDERKTVNVAFAQQSVIVMGGVTVQKDDRLPETIHMVVEGMPWSASISPTEERVTGEIDSFGFTLTTVVPEMYDDGDYTGKVTAIWYDKDSVPHSHSDTFTISVIKVPFEVFTDKKRLSIDAGASETVTITIVDHSPLAVTYLVQMDSLWSPGVLPWLDWRVAALGTDRIELDPGGSESFEVDINIPANATSGTFHVPIIVSIEESPEHSHRMDITVSVNGVPIPKPGGGDDDDDSWLPFDAIYLFYAIALVVVIGIIGFLGGTEVGLLALMWGLLLPLFTRLKRDEVLNQFTRGEIYGFIKANPGVHLTAIKENLEVANGVLAYHLKVLMREEFIVARREGGYKRFYPRDMQVPRKRVHFTRLQLDIVDKLRMHPGLTQAALSRLLDESKQVINYNISVLIAADVVRVERDGSKTRCFVTKEAPRTIGGDGSGFDEDADQAKGTPSQTKW